MVDYSKIHGLVSEQMYCLYAWFVYSYMPHTHTMAFVPSACKDHLINPVFSSN